MTRSTISDVRIRQMSCGGFFAMAKIGEVLWINDHRFSIRKNAFAFYLEVRDLWPDIEKTHYSAQWRKMVSSEKKDWRRQRISYTGKHKASKVESKREIKKQILLEDMKKYPVKTWEEDRGKIEKCRLHRRIEGCCPIFSCRYNLYLDVTFAGSIKYNFYGLEVDEIPETCALEVSEVPMTLEGIGIALNVSRERARQEIKSAIKSFRKNMSESLMGIVRKDLQLSDRSKIQNKSSAPSLQEKSQKKKPGGKSCSGNRKNKPEIPGIKFRRGVYIPPKEDHSDRLAEIQRSRPLAEDEEAA